MNSLKLIALTALTVFFISCESLHLLHSEAESLGIDTEKLGETVLGNTGIDSTASKPILTDADIISGLKEALAVGTKNAVSVLNAQDGYFKNPVVKLLFPPDAQRAADKLREAGMGKLVDNFEESLNRAAEDAAVEAQQIFVDAILQMSFDDAKGILKGGNGAATEYFKRKTTEQLLTSFSPKIKASLDKVHVTKYWTDITSTYNMIPFVDKVNTDLTAYATDKAMDGLFLKVEEEENKIRQNATARVTDLLKRVFGSLE